MRPLQERGRQVRGRTNRKDSLMRNSLNMPWPPQPRRGKPRTSLSPHRTCRHRTIFISDTHLGTRGCKAELLADFLSHNDCQTLYLVGDIVDGWRLKKNWYWSPSHSAVLDAILRKVDEGTRVVYVPGNHDEVFRDYCG